MSCKNHLELQNFSTASWLKIQVDSILIEQLVLSWRIEWKVSVNRGLTRPVSSLYKISNSSNMTQ